MNYLSRLFLMVAVCLPMSLAAKESVSWLRTQSDCLGFTPGTTIVCNRIMESRQLLEKEAVNLIPDNKGRVVAREIALVAWDQEPHIIRLEVPFRVSKPELLTVQVKTPGYVVERVRGTGLYKLQFRVTKDGVELPVYGGKHVWVPQTFGKEWSYHKLTSVMETRQYLPFQEHLFNEELAKRGQDYLEDFIEEAREELKDVPSRTFPSMTLTEMYPKEVALSLIVIEHTDPYKLFDSRVKTSLPPESYLRGTLIEIALHGPAAFADLCSHAFACGWTQFTNSEKWKWNPKKKLNELTWPGTYNYTYKECRTRAKEPVLLQDFRDGARDAKNAVKAAICYLDLENAALPKQVHEEYLQNPKLGSIPMLTGYNAGGGWSKWIHRTMMLVADTPGPQKLEDMLTHEVLPKTFFVRNNYYNLETHWYIKKHLWLWDLLYRDRQITVPSPR